MQAKLAVLPGDGIGPEIIAEAVKVLEAIAQRYNHRFELTYGDMGGVAIDNHGVPFPEDTIKICESSDAILFGAVGDPRFDDPKLTVRPEQGLLQIRKHFGLFANLRPVKVNSALMFASPVKPELLEGVDMVVVRELTGGIYFGEPSKRFESKRGRRAVDTLSYTDKEIERVTRLAFDMAGQRRKLVTMVDKANVLTSSRLWREIGLEVAKDYPDITFEYVLVDACAMFLIQNPRRFDVIVTENMFGDILTDEASVLAGSLGLLPSASLGKKKGRSIKKPLRFGLYEPIHGSAPTIKGQNIANPIATILSAAMLLRYSLGLYKEANAIEKAVDDTIKEGYRSSDLAKEGDRKVSTTEMGTIIARKIIGA
jgi:3-isopropylmalate dehydrogenase